MGVLTYELLPCAAPTLSVLAPTAQSETSTRAAIATLIKMRLCFIYITVFRWRAAPCASIDIHADVTASGKPLPKVVTNRPIHYKGCRSVFVTVMPVTDSNDRYTQLTILSVPSDERIVTCEKSGRSLVAARRFTEH